MSATPPEQRPVRAAPSSEAIDRMDEALGWIVLAEWRGNANRTTMMRQVVWLRARSWRWNRITAVVECSERHARALRTVALATIACRLNGRSAGGVQRAFLTATRGR